MEGMIDRIATGSSALALFLVTSGLAFVVFAALWIAFGAGVLWSHGSVTAAWEWIRGLPLLVQLVVWFIFLPVVAGLWVWETTWPLVLRLVVVVGLAGWTLFMFLPRALLQGAAR